MGWDVRYEMRRDRKFSICAKMMAIQIPQNPESLTCYVGTENFLSLQL